MIDKKYQIFISSTYLDLKQARKKVIETVLNLYHHPVGMEMFSADDDEQWEVIKETIRSSDYYIVLIGHRYGSTTKEGISYTEKEYDFAKELGIPVLAFVRERDVSTKPQERDSDSKLATKVDNFVDKATDNKMCDFWQEPEYLATKIAVALPKIFRRHKRPGWIRAESESGNISEELARLSKENNKLRKENENLKKDEKKPDLEVEINGEKELNLQLKEFTLPSPPPKIFAEDIPNELKSTISDFQLRDYNSRIPSLKIIENLKDEYHEFWEVKYNSIPIKIDVINSGYTKANSVWVGIKFPDSIKVISKHEYNNNSLPFILELLESETPIDQAENRIKTELGLIKNQEVNSNVVINTSTQ